MCGEANFDRFSNQDTITYYLEKAKETGFNNIVVDVKPIEGKVLYKSKIVPELTCVDSLVVERDWDYLQYVIDEAHRLGMKVTASACVFPIGSSWWQKGLCYEDSTFDGRTCLEYRPEGTMEDIRTNTTKVAAFLNPVRQDSRDYAMSVLSEIVSNYEIDGLALDYCRFPDMESDFSAESRDAFEKYIGVTVENWPADIFTYDGNGEVVPGKYYNEWLAFRAGVLHDFITNVSDSMKTIRPELELNYWAGSWIHAIEKNGQNWASPRSEWCKKYPYGSDAYQKAGFAPALDNFIVGAYLERVYGPDDNESVEYALNRADSIIMGDCHVIGSIQSINHSADAADPHNLTNAVKCCLENSEGLMVFDVVHIINRDQWAQIKKGIDEYQSTVI
ncbi:MAG: family 10 glycosylhydrolase, partial [Muribaculaceae bacterium]|nr:family 10 glycosylhydrolase [Muribaculaceae bacterium]